MKNIHKNSNKSLRKKAIIILMVVALAVFVYDLSQSELKGSLTAEAPVVSLDDEQLPEPDDSTTNEDSTTTADSKNYTTDAEFFASYRMERDSVRDEELAVLDGIIKDEATDAKTLAEAQARKMDIAADMECELQAEMLLEAKGLGEALVSMSEDKMNIVISGKLDDTKASQAADICANVSGLGYENIIIIDR